MPLTVGSFTSQSAPPSITSTRRGAVDRIMSMSQLPRLVDLGPTKKMLLIRHRFSAGRASQCGPVSDAFDVKGWFDAGDLDSLEGDGYLHVIARSKNLIITSGYNVYPREVEDALRQYPGVTDVAVAGLPSTEWGESVARWVIADRDLDADELLAFAATRLGRYKCPRKVHIVAEFPRNALGKVLKNELVADFDKRKRC